MPLKLYKKTLQGLLDFARVHVAAWDEALAEGVPIGLDAADVAELQALLDEAKSAKQGAVDARAASKAATRLQNARARQLARGIGNAVAMIRATAESSPDPTEIYEAALLKGRANPSPAPGPTPPEEVHPTLNNDGHVLIEWKATQENGAFYSVWRQLPGEAKPSYVGSTSEKHFLDEHLPAGAPYASYTVRSHRRSLESPSSQPVQILFGTRSEQAA